MKYLLASIFIAILISITLLMAQTPKPRIAVGGIIHESNTFSEDKTDLQDFAGRLITRGDEIFTEFATSAHEVGGYIEGAENLGWSWSRRSSPTQRSRVR